MNVLLFGMCGTGKSSFINTAYSAVSRGLHLEMAKSGGSTGHVTTTYRRHRLARLAMDGRQLSVEQLSHLTLWDAWGMDGKNYAKYELVRMLNGEMGTRCDMNAVPAHPVAPNGADEQNVDPMERRKTVSTLPRNARQ